jgi:hypothetical protein
MKMKKEKIEYSGTDIWFLSMHYVDRTLYDKKNTCCYICKENIIPDEPIYLVMNNWQIFPNAFVHGHCADHLGFINTTALLKREYEEARKHKHWFV